MPRKVNRLFRMLYSPQVVWFPIFAQQTYNLHSLLPCAQLHLQVGGRTEGQLSLLVLFSPFVFQHTLQLRLASGQ